MQNIDYSFWFDPIQNQYNKARFLNHSTKTLSEFDVRLDDISLCINGLSTLPSISADLLDLAVVIHVVDRLVHRQKDVPHSFQIELPIRNPDVFLSNDIATKLTNLLEWYTGDCWYFNFEKRKVSGRPVEMQSCLPWTELPQQQIEIALWSGGLDSLSGLYNRLLGNQDTYHVLIGTGANNQVIMSQQEVANAIKKVFPDRISLNKIPYSWFGTPTTQKNFDQRSRGLVFMLIGAACAHHYGQKTLFIYENGIGAINLPYSKAQSGLDQAKSVHPLSLLYLGKFVSLVLGSKFRFSNPFEFFTKSQMCKSLVKNNASDLIALTSSCDRPRRLPQGITQCGACSSCLLRRQAITDLGIVDPTMYENDGFIDTRGDSHLRAMIHQIQTMRGLLSHPDPWYMFSKEYYELNDIVEHISNSNGRDLDLLRKKIIMMYQKYVNEWRLFERIIKKKVVRNVGSYA